MIAPNTAIKTKRLRTKKSGADSQSARHFSDPNVFVNSTKSAFVILSGPRLTRKRLIPERHSSPKSKADNRHHPESFGISKQARALLFANSPSKGLPMLKNHDF